MSSGKGIGKLKFKGDSGPIKLKKKPTDAASSSSSSSSSSSAAAANRSQEPEEVKEVVGTGRITSSATTIQGHQTKFMSELEPGDAIVITHPTSLQTEMKVVRMVLSNVSIGVSSAFSTDLISTTAFRYIKCPKDANQKASAIESTEEKAARKRKSEDQDVAEVTLGGAVTSANTGTIVYRVKKPGAFGGYKIVSESTEGTSRESLLDARSKKKSDRFCY